MLGEMKVRRVRDGNLSRVEPRFDRTWSPLTQLRWDAAVTTLDSGIPVEVELAQYWIAGVMQHDYFVVRCAGGAIGPMGIRAAMDVMTGIAVGANAAQVRDMVRGVPL